ncbi:hypothetical protein NX059_002864 [Plenodomus lindquistii]|nr:hypothetical protein NX059_002864 [Plenodomus lindquistii]
MPLKDRVGTDSSIQSDGAQVRNTSPVRVLNARLQDAFGDLGRFDEDLHPKEYGRHGDINPKNILRYRGNIENEDEQSGNLYTVGGTLAIADFGQAELNSFKTKTKRRDVANTMTYRPPECDIATAKIQQSYDIWCLGCVYLEFVAWFLGGRQLLRDFARQRLAPDVFLSGKDTDTFFQVLTNQKRDTFVVKPAVTKFINRLHQHRNCTAYLHDFLELIQHGMIVIKSAKRLSCVELRDRLRIMHNNCRTNTDYATVPVSRSDKDALFETIILPYDNGREIAAYAENIMLEDLATPHDPITERDDHAIAATGQNVRKSPQKIHSYLACCLLVLFLWLYTLYGLYCR